MLKGRLVQPSEPLIVEGNTALLDALQAAHFAHGP